MTARLSMSYDDFAQEALISESGSHVLMKTNKEKRLHKRND